MSSGRFRAGDVIGGKFRVERILGTGGMGLVVLAKHAELGQRVAIKLMLEESASDPAHAERFQREARSAVQLQSIHTARVLDVGRLKNGEPFMVMEYLEGEDLDEFVKKTGPLPPNVAVDYVLQACEAFAEAHGLGMIHRDIKLKNLFLTKTVDGRPLVKVLDFGLAKMIGIGNTDVSLTATSAVFGSPQYMSPEQMRSAKDVDTRSDIWSIGVCLYELLTGHVPFDAAGVAEICAMVLKDPVPPLSKWVVGLAPELETIVARCLEKDPTKRYQSVAELAFALEPYAIIEGSARRILNVMESARRADGNITLVNVDPSAVSEGPRTMSAWDSGERERQKTSRGTTRTLVIATMSFLAVAVLGVMIAVLLRAKPRADDASASSALLVPAPPPTVGPDPSPPAADTTTPAAAPLAVATTTGEPTASAAAPTAMPTPVSTTTSAAAVPVKRPPASPRATAAAKPTTTPARMSAPAPPAPAKPAKDDPFGRL